MSIQAQLNPCLILMKATNRSVVFGFEILEPISALSVSPIPGRTTTNSSPPNREKVSLSRISCETREVIFFNRSSPTPWPMGIVDLFEPVKINKNSARVRRSPSNTRFGRSVSASYFAMLSSCFWYCLTSVISFKRKTYQRISLRSPVPCPTRPESQKPGTVLNQRLKH